MKCDGTCDRVPGLKARIADLEAKLAEAQKNASDWESSARYACNTMADVAKERDAARAGWNELLDLGARQHLHILELEEALRGSRDAVSSSVASENALRAEVARLRAAIEPTAANVQALVFAWKSEGGRSAVILPKDTGAVHAILAAITARAGEVSAPGSSLRERVEAAIRRMPDCTCTTTDCRNKCCYGDCGPALLRAALGEP